MGTQKLALCALFSAMAVILLLLSSIMPTMQLAMIAFSGLFTAAAVIEAGVIPALSLWLCVSVLSFLLLPDKSSALIYFLYFGHYPIIKFLFERLRFEWLSWLCKFAAFLVCLLLLSFLLSAFFPLWTADITYSFYVLLGMCVVVFFLYDITMTKLLIFYQRKVRTKLTRRF